jgi:AraC family transcriptional regulator
MTLQQRSRLAVPPAPAIDWATEAATVTFYVPLGVLRATRDTVVVGATGTMVWVSQAEEAGIIPTVHPALLVQTVFATLQEACVELVPHLPADDPLRHHMGLVLQTAFEAEDATSQLYVASLADALAAHFLHRYRACRHPAAHEVIGGLSPIKLQRTTAYIQAHLEQELCLTTLAALVHLSPDHFARLFKQATGRTPHQYVLECRIARAKRLLAETDLPLSTISLQVGCADQSYFTALFRKHVAMTPKAYRDTRVQV